jgi:ribonuclease PH
VTVDADVFYRPDAGPFARRQLLGLRQFLADALGKLVKRGELERSPLSHQIAAVSVGNLIR